MAPKGESRQMQLPCGTDVPEAAMTRHLEHTSAAVPQRRDWGARSQVPQGLVRLQGLDRPLGVGPLPAGTPIGTGVAQSAGGAAWAHPPSRSRARGQRDREA
jgi:hypothetical protein